MTDELLSCNYEDCLAPITKWGWLTRCSHVFCKEHGDKFNLVNSSKVKCPSCTEVLNKSNDISKFNTNPSDLILCCVRPEKALDYALRATKLWCYQMKIKRKIQLQSVTEKYDRMAFEATRQLQSENGDLKKYIQDLDKELEKVNNELGSTKRRLQKYKAAYEASRKNSRPSRSREFSFIPDDNLSLGSQIHSQPNMDSFLNRF